MNWKVKANIQNAVAPLPLSLSYSTYYWIQRHFGTLRRVNPVSTLMAGIGICEKIVGYGKTLVGKVFFEVGTGRRINTPIAFWLLGAEKVITVDLNPYIKQQLVREDISFIRENRTQIEDLFKQLNLIKDRFERLNDFTRNPWDIDDLFKLCNIEYIGPANAADLPVPDASVDYHTSRSVLEHIPPAAIMSILKEAIRITKDEGLFIHRIDYSDHFSHSDKSISSINFLQFSDDEWAKIAGNRYAYTNRLRVDDFEDLFRKSSHRILSIDSDKDPSVPELLKNNVLRINERFKHKSEEVLATVSSWIVSEKCV